MSFRIEFIGQRRIDRSPMPASLSHIYCNSDEWNHFCNQVDEPLRDLVSFKKRSKRTLFILWTIAIALIVSYIFFLRSVFGLPKDNSVLPDYIVLGVPIVSLALITGIRKNWAIPKAVVHAFQTVDKALVKESDRKKVVSYHLKSDQYQQLERGSDGWLQITDCVDFYIECNVITVAVALGGDTFQNNPNTPSVKNNDSKPSIKKRLQELVSVGRGI